MGLRFVNVLYIIMSMIWILQVVKIELIFASQLPFETVRHHYCAIDFTVSVPLPKLAAWFGGDGGENS